MIINKLNDLKFNLRYKYIFEKYGNDFLNISIHGRDIPEKFIEHYIKYLNMSYILKHNKLSIQFLNKHMHELLGNYKIICKYQTLDLQFIDKYKDVLYWSYIIIYQNIPFDFLIKHIDYINLKFLNRCIMNISNSRLNNINLTENQLFYLKKLKTNI